MTARTVQRHRFGRLHLLCVALLAAVVGPALMISAVTLVSSSQPIKARYLARGPDRG